MQLTLRQSLWSLFRLSLPYVVLILLRLWLTTAQDLSYQGTGYHDDRLFIELAEHLRYGEWLGEYNHLTLAKGPFYPFFIALMSWFKIPLLLGQNLLYISGVIAMTWALHPLFKRHWLTFFFFALLLFQPASFEGDATARVIRAGVGVSLTLLALAGFIRAYVAQLSQPTAIWLGIGTGLALAAFWMNREDNLWLVPALGLLVIGKWLVSYFQRTITYQLFTFTTGVTCFFTLPILFVCMMNTHFYQIFTVTDFQHFAFPAAYGALVRVKPIQHHQFIPVTASTRQLLYSVSPTFQQLQPVIENELAANWASNSVDLTGYSPQLKEIAGGWWMWALRDAVLANGHYRSGADSAAYYTHLADEINGLCESQRLKCAPPRSGMLPMITPPEWQLIATSVPKFFMGYFSTVEMMPYIKTSFGTRADIKLFQVMTNEQLYLNQNYGASSWEAADWKERRFLLLEKISQVYQLVALPVIAVAFVAFLLILEARQPLSIVPLALFSSTGTLFVIVSIIHTTSFYAYGNLYLAPVYPLMVAFTFCSLVLCIDPLKKLPRRLKRAIHLALDKSKPRIIKKGFDDAVGVKFMR